MAAQMTSKEPVRVTFRTAAIYNAALALHIVQHHTGVVGTGNNLRAGE
jgi:hypothetical protein